MIKVATILLMFGCGTAFADTLTTTRLVRANTVISAPDVAVSKSKVPGALSSDIDIVGLEARTTLYPGHPIRPNDVGPPALVERNQPVVIVYKSGGLTIYADARSLSRGAVGEIVKAMNASSRTTVFGRVAPDGTVLVLE